MTTLLLNNIKSSDPINLKRLLEARNKSGTTALMIAVDQRDFPLIELLIGTAGADVKAVDGNGDTALIRATKNLTDTVAVNFLISPLNILIFPLNVFDLYNLKVLFTFMVSTS